MSAHVCHAHGCSTPVPPRMFMCRAHWFKLSKPMRDAIWREYRPGQENDKQPSARYMAVQRRAVAEVAFRPNDEQAALAAAPYMVESEEWRERAVLAGEGDPLEFTGRPPAFMLAVFERNKERTARLQEIVQTVVSAKAKEPSNV